MTGRMNDFFICKFCVVIVLKKSIDIILIDEKIH